MVTVQVYLLSCSFHLFAAVAVLEFSQATINDSISGWFKVTLLKCIVVASFNHLSLSLGRGQLPLSSCVDCCLCGAF